MGSSPQARPPTGQSTWVAATLFEDLVVYQGTALPAHRVAQAAAFYDDLKPALAKFRATTFPFLEGAPEPATADQWIENGGVSWQISLT